MALILAVQAIMLDISTEFMETLVLQDQSLAYWFFVSIATE